MSEQEIRDLCQDRHKYPFEIPDTFGEGITGSKYYTQRTKRPREVRLKITSFIGVCGGAMHYYGELVSYSPTVSEIGGDPSMGFLEPFTEKTTRSYSKTLISILIYFGQSKTGKGNKTLIVLPSIIKQQIVGTTKSR